MRDFHEPSNTWWLLNQHTDHEPSNTWWPLNKHTDHEPSYTWWPLNQPSVHWSRAIQHSMTAQLTHWSRATQLMMTAQPTNQPTRTSITSHPTNDDRSSDREPSLHLMTAPPTRLGHRSRAILHLMTAPLIASLPVHIQQHLMTAQLTVQWIPLPLRYHLTTYTYKNTCLIINNNYLIIHNKTRPHTPSWAIQAFSQQERQTFSQQEHSAFSQHERQA